MLINPAGGQGKAEADFEEHVKPLFDFAEITYNVVVTGRRIGMEALICIP